jgi:DNA-binding protein H-NS
MNLRTITAMLRRTKQQRGRPIASLGRGKIARCGRGSKLKEKKVAPKYRSFSGETWAGRGAPPRRLVAAIKGGKKLESFSNRQVRSKRAEEALAL